jgi:hypothetical protein
MNEIADGTAEVDAIVAVLRSPATPAELASEQRVVDLMVQTHTRASEAPVKRHLRPGTVAVLLAAGVIGFGGAAAAGPGGLDPFGLDDETEVVDEPVVEEPVADDPAVEAPVTDEPATEEPATDEPTVEESDVDEPAIEEEVLPEPAPSDETVEPAAPENPLFVDNPATAFDERYCKAGPHGATVSAVARGDAGFEDFDVSDAAQSDCGKPGLQAAPADEEIEPTDVEPDPASGETEPAPAVDPDEAKDAGDDSTEGPPGNGNGKGNGNGNGNGNGGNSEGKGAKGRGTGG